MNTMVLIFSTITACAVANCGWADEVSDQTGWSKWAVLRAGQEVQGDYFAVGPQVEISGTVHGDLYAAGGEVLIDGTVDGDVIVAGGKVTLSGHVTQDVRAAGGNVTLSGQIDRNVSVAGGDVHLTDSAHIRGNLLSGAGNIQLAGQVDQDARIGAGNMTGSNKIGGSLAVAAAHIRLTSKASIGKNVRYWSEEEPSIDEGARITGTVTRREIPESLKGEKFQRGLTGMKVMAGFVSLVSTLLLGLLLLRIYPVFSERVAATIQERPGASVGLGGLLLIGVPLLIALFMATVVAMPIGLMLGAMYLVTLYRDPSVGRTDRGAAYSISTGHGAKPWRC
ncbi:MAG: polymer-forming cytoskeletal protein [Nitrospira sp.]|nr:polymer-forming cytoskeletal protein [Nitrospira sp.]MDH5193107.1 polymer-forming cytoskeletal protein [Nitrospira sp.]